VEPGGVTHDPGEDPLSVLRGTQGEKTGLRPVRVGGRGQSCAVEDVAHRQDSGLIQRFRNVLLVVASL
jgi:hypothetical protein